jgi:hypothetical protein
MEESRKIPSLDIKLSGPSSISAGQYAMNLTTPITAEEQNWVDKFIIAADEKIDGDMSWMNRVLTLAVQETH